MFCSAASTISSRWWTGTEKPNGRVRSPQLDLFNFINYFGSFEAHFSCLEWRANNKSDVGCLMGNNSAQRIIHYALGKWFDSIRICCAAWLVAVASWWICLRLQQRSAHCEMQIICLGLTFHEHFEHGMRCDAYGFRTIMNMKRAGILLSKYYHRTSATRVGNWNEFSVGFIFIAHIHVNFGFRSPACGRGSRSCTLTGRW